MKRIALITALALALTACGASTPAPKLTPPSPAIVAMAHPPATVAPVATQSLVRTLDHKFWSMQVPSAWEVVGDSEEGVKVNRLPAPGVLPASIQVISQDLGDSPAEEFVMVMSIMAEKTVPEGVTVTDVQRQAGKYKGHTSSVTQVNTSKGVFLGVLAMVDEVHKTGYAVVAIAPMVPADGKLMGKISQTFTLKTDAPPEAEEEATPAPAPVPAPKATPKKK